MPLLASSETCTGCAACANICPHSAIVMTPDAEGFLYPTIDSSKCVECKLCEKRCPAIVPLTEMGTASPKTYAVWDEQDRYVSSSGGAFSSFAKYVLAEKGIVFGASFDERMHCRHTEIQSMEELPALRGSKYVQSEIGDTFKRIRSYLKENRKVLFCGTPCQVAGLKSFLGKRDENLLTLDLVCHGVPSDAIFQSYLKKISSRFAADVNGCEFRQRDGWGKTPFVAVSGKLRPVYGVDAIYMEAFNASAIFRKCCYNCQYTCLPRAGECTLGDFWGIGHYGIPFRHDTLKGVSLVLANNERGERMLHRLRNCFIEERTLDEALIENHNLKYPSAKHPYRENIIEEFLNPAVSLDDMDAKYKLVDHSIKATVKNLASQLGLFDLVKRIYNWYKIKSYGKA